MKRKFITFGRIINTGLINFVRSFGLALAAMAIMVVTLTIILSSVVVNAAFTSTIAQVTKKIDVSVYLKDSVTDQQAQQLVSQLKALPNTQSISYQNKAQVLVTYQKQNAGNAGLLAAISQTDNPLPATISIKPRNLNQLSGLKTFLSKPAEVALQSDLPSYSGDSKTAIDKITHATDVLREAGIIAVVVFTVISVLIIFNTIQMAIFNRRDEIQIMRLLGASTSYIRGPFVVEAIIYGTLSAIFSVLIVNALFVASASTLQATTLGLLDISFAQNYFSQHYWKLLLIQLALGILIGAASSTIATRRYLKFKVSKK